MDIWDLVKGMHYMYLKFPKKRRVKTMFENIIARIFKSEKISAQIEVLRTLSRINVKTAQRHVIVMLLKSKDKNKRNMS